MPLVRGQNIVFETVKGIHFLMRDPNTREFIACLITHQALIDSGAAHEPGLATRSFSRSNTTIVT
jgi:hypothetical protein